MTSYRRTYTVASAAELEAPVTVAPARPAKPTVILHRSKVLVRSGRYPWTYWYNGEHAGRQLGFTSLGGAKDWAMIHGVKLEIAKDDENLGRRAMAAEAMMHRMEAERARTEA